MLFHMNSIPLLSNCLFEFYIESGAKTPLHMSWMSHLLQNLWMNIPSKSGSSEEEIALPMALGRLPFTLKASFLQL